METKTIPEGIAAIHDCGFWSFPFHLCSKTAKAIIDESVSNVDFQSEDESFWHMIEHQRIRFKAALLVIDGTSPAFNPALRHFGVII